jgi:hypothetical protein
MLGKDDDVIASLFQALAAAALPADWPFPEVGLLTLQAVRGRQGEHQQGEQDVHTQTDLHRCNPYKPPGDDCEPRINNVGSGAMNVGREQALESINVGQNGSIIASRYR